MKRAVHLVAVSKQGRRRRKVSRQLWHDGAPRFFFADKPAAQAIVPRRRLSPGATLRIGDVARTKGLERVLPRPRGNVATGKREGIRARIAPDLDQRMTFVGIDDAVTVDVGVSAVATGAHRQIRRPGRRNLAANPKAIRGCVRRGIEQGVHAHHAPATAVVTHHLQSLERARRRFIEGDHAVVDMQAAQLRIGGHLPLGLTLDGQCSEYGR